MHRALSLAAAALLLGAAAGGGQWPWPVDRPAPAIPADNPMSAAKVELGRRLFYDADLSADGSMACSTCHVQRRGFAEGNATHPGVHGDPGRRNAPGLANVGWAKTLTWSDPRLTSLEAQALKPITGTDPIEMGMHGREAEIASRLTRDDCYVRMFRDAFPDVVGRIDMGTVAKALGAFERTLISNRAPYDRWRAGDRTAISATEQAGARGFSRNCAACHSGPDFSDSRFHRIQPAAKDAGLGTITGKPSDNGAFSTPRLRNVMLAPPYFHDGSAKTLADVLDRHIGIGSRLTAEDREAILAFLVTLTDRAFTTDPRYALPQTACGVPL